jgi:hypothetical protein
VEILVQPLGRVRYAKKFVLAALAAAITTQWTLSEARAEESKPITMWAVAAVLTKGQYNGSAIYLTPDLVITAAHVAGGWTGDIQAHIAGADVPAVHVKTGKFEEVDLALFSVDRHKLPASVGQIQASLCAGPAWEGDPVIVADRDWGEPIPHCFTDDPGPSLPGQIRDVDRGCCDDGQFWIRSVRPRS